MKSAREKGAAQRAAIEASIGQSPRQRMLEKASRAAELFEGRWTLNALLRVDPDLHEALEDQQGRFHESLSTKNDVEIAEQGEAMCRGWAAAIQAMERSGEAQDAIHIGTFGPVVVAIGRQRYAPEWVRDQYGEGIVWLTPREVAALHFRVMEAENVKRLWPDVEIVGVRKKEGVE